MIHLGLNRADHRAFERTLAASHRVRLRVHLLDRDERPTGDELTIGQEFVVDGSVSVDFSAGITRKLDLTVVDKHRKLQLDPDSAAASIWPDTFVRVRYGVFVEDLGDGPDWVDVPVFHGLVTHFTRTEHEVTLEGMGKEILALDPYLTPRSVQLQKGERLAKAVRALLDGQGETKYRGFAHTKAKLHHDQHVPRWSEAWKVARHLARVDDMQLFYDGRGRVTLRKLHRPHQTQFQFRDGEGGTMLTLPTLSADLTTFKNVVIARGPRPHGSKKAARRLIWRATVPAAHPLSPQSLARNGVERVAVEVMDLPQAKRIDKVRTAAENELERQLLLAREVSFESLPVPHLEEHDAVRTSAGDLDAVHFLKTWSLPLTAGGTMSVSYVKRNRRPTPVGHQVQTPMVYPKKSGGRDGSGSGTPKRGPGGWGFEPVAGYTGPGS
jgi:hypothetical protein